MSYLVLYPICHTQMSRVTLWLSPRSDWQHWCRFVFIWEEHGERGVLIKQLQHWYPRIHRAIDQNNASLRQLLCLELSNYSLHSQKSSSFEIIWDQRHYSLHQKKVYTFVELTTKKLRGQMESRVCHTPYFSSSPPDYRVLGFDTSVHFLLMETVMSSPTSSLHRINCMS